MRVGFIVNSEEDENEKIAGKTKVLEVVLYCWFIMLVVARSIYVRGTKL